MADPDDVPGWSSRALVTRAPLTNVPFVEPESSTQIPSVRLSRTAWRFETVVSASSRIAFSAPRPTRVVVVSSNSVPGSSAGLERTTTVRDGGATAARRAAASAAGRTMLSCGAPTERPRVAERTTSQTNT